MHDDRVDALRYMLEATAKPKPLPWWTRAWRWLKSRAAAVGRVRVKPMFAWYDMWVGVFWDATKRRLYILPLPCLGFRLDFAPQARAATKMFTRPAPPKEPAPKGMCWSYVASLNKWFLEPWG